MTTYAFVKVATGSVSMLAPSVHHISFRGKILDEEVGRDRHYV